jgi:hypothetical protein
MGQDLSTFKDIEKRPVIAMISAIGANPQPDASGWVFYLWENPWHSYPMWKGSYIRKAIAPDGKVYLVGSGLYNIKIEKVFIQERVDKAAELIITKGKDAAFKELNDRSSPLHILDIYIFVVGENGDVLVDPLFPNIEPRRNIMQYRDYAGRHISQEIRGLLKDRDSTWTLYIAPKTSTGRPVRHLEYVRKIKVDGEVFYVGAGFAPATPIWMK